MFGGPWKLRVTCPEHGLLYSEDLADDDAADLRYLDVVVGEVAAQHLCRHRLDAAVREAHVLR